ncbi:MAG: rod shape-determining protein MreD [Xanthomonadales bacterium]|nr:rod shape-determining protein MreD [Xanthomonadales bacterium]
MSRFPQDLRLFGLTLAAAMLLTLLPLPGFLQMFKPYWVALVLIYWGLETSDLVRLGLAFVLGLLLDLLTGSLLGLHALSLVVLTYLVHRFRSQIRFFPAWQQALAVLALLVNDRIILLWVISLLGEPVPTWRYWLPTLAGMLLWPWIFLLMDRLRSGVRRHRA